MPEPQIIKKLFAATWFVVAAGIVVACAMMLYAIPILKSGLLVKLLTAALAISALWFFTSVSANFWNDLQLIADSIAHPRDSEFRKRAEDKNPIWRKQVWLSGFALTLSLIAYMIAVHIGL